VSSIREQRHGGNYRHRALQVNDETRALAATGARLRHAFLAACGGGGERDSAEGHVKAALQTRGSTKQAVKGG
jgi:hypothetical protein